MNEATNGLVGMYFMRTEVKEEPLRSAVAARWGQVESKVDPGYYLVLWSESRAERGIVKIEWLSMFCEFFLDREDWLRSIRLHKKAEK